MRENIQFWCCGDSRKLLFMSLWIYSKSRENNYSEPRGCSSTPRFQNTDSKVSGAGFHSFAGWEENLSCQKGRSLQHTPDCALRIHTCKRVRFHTTLPARGLAPSTWPLSGGKESVHRLWLWHSVVLLEMKLGPSVSSRCRGLAYIEPRALWPSCVARKGWKAAQAWNDTLQPVWCQAMFHLFARTERIRDNFVFICESNESTVSTV